MPDNQDQLTQGQQSTEGQAPSFTVEIPSGESASTAPAATATSETSAASDSSADSDWTVEEANSADAPPAGQEVAPEPVNSADRSSAAAGAESAAAESGTDAWPEVGQVSSPTPAPPASRYLDEDEVRWAGRTINSISTAFSDRVVGQGRLQETLIIALLTGGHVLLESVPGLAKTTAAQAISQAVNGSFHRIQCTPDLLPSDIVGTQVYNQHSASFETQLGPVHANFVLLDEINRSSAKTQSAMLEAMQERQTSIGDHSYPLPSPFLVLATQNPIEQEGTYPLPEAQMDRFMLKDVLDYPSPAEEAEVLRRIDAGVFLTGAKSVASIEDVVRLQELTSRVYIDPAIINYIVGLTYVTRHPGDYIDPRLAGYVDFGASPRASIAFTAAARARALIDGRNHVVPDDVKALAHRVLRHRVTLGFEAIADDVAVEQVIDAMVAGIRTP